VFGTGTKRRQLEEIIELVRGIGIMLMDTSAKLQTVIGRMGEDDGEEPDA
jgi:hypothetical protein